MVTEKKFYFGLNLVSEMNSEVDTERNFEVVSERNFQLKNLFKEF